MAESGSFQTCCTNEISYTVHERQICRSLRVGCCICEGYERRNGRTSAQCEDPVRQCPARLSRMAAREQNYQLVWLSSHSDLPAKTVIQKSRIRVWTNLAAAKADFELPLALDYIANHALCEPSFDITLELLSEPIRIHGARIGRRVDADAIYLAGRRLASVVHVRRIRIERAQPRHSRAHAHYSDLLMKRHPCSFPGGKSSKRRL